MDNPKHLWDEAAVTFDQEADHGLRDPNVLQAWTELLKAWMPPKKASVLDVGCGTGSLSLILARLGYTVTGIDISPQMLAQAQVKAKTAGQAIAFSLMDAASPHFAPQSFDVLVCRHVLWALSDPPQVLKNWVNLLTSLGRLILIEGYWDTGVGLPAKKLVAGLPPTLKVTAVQDLSTQPAYWGRMVKDERYVIIADLHA